MLESILSVRLSGDLRMKLAARAAKDDISDSALVRNLVADLVSADAPVDRKSGPRFVLHVPPEDLAAMSVMLGNVTKLVVAAQAMPEGQGAGAVAALEAAHARLVRIIQRAEG